MGGRESFFFSKDVAPDWLPICPRMALCPSTYLQRYKSLFSIALLIMTRKWMESTYITTNRGRDTGNSIHTVSKFLFILKSESRKFEGNG